MALPQGINFRSTLGYVTDGANDSFEQANATATYPRTTAQGNNVGWELGVGNIRDRNAGVDPRLAGMHFSVTTNGNFRIDLPSTGNYDVRLAAGDYSSSIAVGWALYDTNTSLATLSSGSTSTTQRWKDALNVEYNATTWPTSNSPYAATFTTTIMRVRSTNNSCIAHVSVAASAGGGTTIPGALGTAVASGFKGNVNAARILAGSLGTAVASGLKGNVNANRTIAGALGVAVASGFKGNVNANRTIVGTLGVAVASGFQGTVVNGAGTTITGNLGTAVASGFKGNVNANRTIAGNLGVAVASGFTGGVQNGTPAPEPPHRRHAGGYYKHKKGYLIKGERYYLDDRELAIKVADMLAEISRSDVKEITAGKPRVVSKRTWTELKATMGRLEALETNDEEEEEALLMFI